MAFRRYDEFHALASEVGIGASKKPKETDYRETFKDAEVGATMSKEEHASRLPNIRVRT
jgi:hypothetical protein